MSDPDDFLGYSSSGDSEEFNKVLWASLPQNVQEKFADQDAIDIYLRKVEKALKEVGLVTMQVGLGVDPFGGRALLQLQTFFDEGEDNFQTDKQLAQMMWDEKKNKTEAYLEELKKAAHDGKIDELGL